MSLKSEIIKILDREREYSRECTCDNPSCVTVYFWDDDIPEFPVDHERCADCGDITWALWDSYWIWARAQEDARGEDNAATNRSNELYIRSRQ